MKRINIICFFSLFVFSIKAQYWAWSAQPNFSGAGEEGYSITADPLGNVYLGGFFAGTITAGTSTLVNPGGSSAFLIKYDSNGNVIWGRAATSSVDCYGVTVSSDNSGNAFLGGFFDSPTIQLGATTLSLSSSGGEDSFIAKYDQNGNLMWAQSSYGSGAVESTCLSNDASGNTYFTGRYLGNFLSFGAYTVTGTPSNFQAFTVKFNPSGNVVWLKQGSSAFGGSTNGACVAAEATGGCFISGNLTNTVQFGTTTLVSVGNSDAYVTKYDVNGNELWAKSITSSGSIAPKGICTDVLGNFYLNGLFGGTVTIGTNTLISIGGDMFIAKFDGNGNPLWAKQSTGPGSVVGYAVTSNSIGIYAVAGYSPSITFGSISYTASASATDPAVVLIMDFNGNIICSDNLDSGGDDTFGAAADPNSNAVYVGGDFNPNLFVLGTNTLNSTAWTGGENAFAARFQCSPTGIKEIVDANLISVFPNPNNGIFKLQYDNGIGNDEMILINSLGQKVHEQKISPGENNIITKDLASGLYHYIILRNKVQMGNGKLSIE